MLTLSHITKRFADFTAVDDLSLHVDPGQVVGFLGPNGAGKTTTIRMVMDILTPDTGAITLLGATSAAAVKDRLGYLPEERGLYRKMTVDATLRYLGKLKGLRGHPLTERIAAALARVELTDWQHKKVEALSKGMQQKLQFVATIMHQPEFVILDEPFSGLDPINSELLKTMLHELRAGGVTVIFSTHVLEQAEKLCDRFVMINRGRKLADGTLAELRQQFPARTCELVGAGDFSALRDHPGVARAVGTRDQLTLDLRAPTDANDVLAAALQHGQVTHFALRQPTLQEIFVRLVSQDRTPAGAAADE